MLPFLKSKQAPVAGLIIKQRSPDSEETHESDDSGIETCAQALISAVHSKDTKATAEALRDIFTILDAQPHEEGEHVEPHSYDAQNIKAGEDR